MFNIMNLVQFQENFEHPNYLVFQKNIDQYNIIFTKLYSALKL